MTVHYRIFDLHEEGFYTQADPKPVATGFVDFRPVVGDRVVVEDHTYVVETCVLHHRQTDPQYLSITILDLLCVRRPG